MLYATDCWDGKIHKQIIEFSSQMLWRFVQSNAKESETEEAVLNLVGLSRKELQLLADIRYLLSDDIRRLIYEIAPKVINKLSKESINETITDRGRVRGRIDWQKTIGSRATAGNDKNIFVYTHRAQIFDLPENRLFLFLIQQIYGKARNFASDDFANLTWYAETENGGKWTNKIDMIASHASRILKNPFISRIGILHEVTPKIIDVTSRCRQLHYKELATVALAFVDVQNKPVAFLKKDLKGNILEPLNKDTIYEIAVLFKTMQAAKDTGWIEHKTSLIGGSKRTVALFKRGSSELKIYYQKLPTDMANNSQYGELMIAYGLSEKLRRPDIVLEFSEGIKKKFMIVEVKRSKNRRYLVDGSYKLLGYLKDFSNVITEDVSLEGMVVGWSGIVPQEYNNKKEVHLFNWNNYDNGMKSVCSKYGESNVE